MDKFRLMEIVLFAISALISAIKSVLDFIAGKLTQSIQQKTQQTGLPLVGSSVLLCPK